MQRNIPQAVGVPILLVGLLLGLANLLYGLLVMTLGLLLTLHALAEEAPHRERTTLSFLLIAALYATGLFFAVSMDEERKASQAFLAHRSLIGCNASQPPPECADEFGEARSDHAAALEDAGWHAIPRP